MDMTLQTSDVDQFTYLDTLGYNSGSKLRISSWIKKLPRKKLPREIYNLIHLEIVAGVIYDISLLNKSKNLRKIKEIYIGGNFYDLLKYREYITKQLPSVKVY